MASVMRSGRGAGRARLDPSVRALQIEEVFRFAGNAAAFSYVGAIFTFLVLWDTGDFGRGSVWFVWATGVTLFRFMTVLSYRRREPGSDPEFWARLVILANFLAGIQWGALGTILFPVEHGYRELFTVMVITCFVGGSLTSYSAISGAHQALALPAILPPAFFLFFFQNGIHLWAGVTAFLFCGTVVYYSVLLNRHLAERFKMQVQFEDLLRVSGGVTERLTIENRELAHKAAVRSASMETARGEAERLFAHFLRSPLPMIECDGQAAIVLCNAAAERLLGGREADLKGHPLHQHLVPVARRMARDAEAYLGNSDASTMEVEIHAHGIRVGRSAIASFTRLPAPEGASSGFGVIIAAPPPKNGNGSHGT